MVVDGPRGDALFGGEGRIDVARAPGEEGWGGPNPPLGTGVEVPATFASLRRGEAR